MDARDLLHLAWIIPALPAFGAVVLLLFGKRIGEPKAGWFATTLMFLAFIAAVIEFFALHSLSPQQRSVISDGFTWIQSGGFKVDFRFFVDPLSSVMILFVTGVGAFIHLYSIGYMHGDERFSRFFAYMNLFAASMLVLVLGSSFLLTFMGWEGVGLCSYLLISFWFERNSAAVAGKKAFITNRVGDFGFMLAMFLIFQKLGSLDYSAMGGAAHLSQSTVTAIALLLFLGAMGKSAQLPLHIWLPDAMEGPTPVSALIHAATMVTAGVFLVVRAHPFFEASNHAGDVVAWVGVITALFAATVALVQNDIKRVLAYSTISQLGYMFLAAGVGAYTAAIFHMVTHAFFKALLFLGAGSVIHGMHDEQDMRRMGGLKKYMPVTAGTFIVGWLAIAGVFPFAGFWSKDQILAEAWYRHHYALWAVGLVTAVITAFYMTRQVWLVFYSDERWRDAQATDAPDAVEAHEPAEQPHAGVHGEPHESPWTMLVPLGVLAVLSVIGGVINLPFINAELDFLGRWLAEPTLAGVEEVSPTSFLAGFVLATVALTLAIVTIVVARAIYLNGLNKDGTDPAADRLGGFAKVLANAYYLDVGLARFVSGPITAFARLLSEGIDRGTIDGAVNGIGKVTRQGSGGIRRLQTGLVRNYALAIVLGTVLLLVYVATRASF
ncbi:MAG TPA: NADH-quinone oxidoreductase subunit L [Acidimicrobiia bacterium]|jgi:NADH-quinone oxidoreductase subunit L|nr:NADH-quinone oxidoreductase subunit L [Acidimicrobiia bacterium]